MEEKRKAEQEELAKKEKLAKVVEVLSSVTNDIVKQALAAMEKEQNTSVEMDDRKRPYHSMKADDGKAPSEEQMEAYYLKKRRTDDPMADFIK